MQSQVTRMYRVKAVAEMFDVSVATIYRAIESGQLTALRIGGGTGAVRIPEYALKPFVDACMSAAQQAPTGKAADAGQADDVVSGEVA
ncbi:helix-turn-helix domain-containing protein [Pseudonocardia spinosispora]|uniref:helix-turn-helix domain-containing protein n=1 Tax=Pseudonocardia spinosispora TaxID=103441 RepID=UPI001FDECC32|nr:helix-turn-helix domain-containing protein [Pseudonocardia spinosispora]